MLACLLACIAAPGLAVEARSQDLATDRTGLKALNNDQQTAFISTGAGSGLFVPVILTASGLNNSYYTSELTLTNRGSHAATLRYTYRAAAGGGSGTASETLAPGRQKIVPDAIAYLGTLGIPIPDTGNRVGTLQVEVSGSAEVGVTVRTTTTVPEGRAGLAYPAVSAEAGFDEPVYLCGLRQNAQDRSNVAFQNMGTAARGEVTLRTTVFSGDPDNPGSQSLGEVTLAPGGFHQFNGILAEAGFSNGYARVERVGGTAPFYAYGVINDQANSDGSFVFPVTESSLAGVRGQTLPVIIEHPNFSSELIVTNFSDSTQAIDFGFVAEAIGRADRTARFSVTLAGGEQRIIPEIVENLRRQGVDGVGPAGRTLAGAVFATARRGDLSGVVIGARTGSPGGGGQYSVFYHAVPYGAAFSETAWIDALQQNRENRSNLALVNTGEVDGGDSVFTLEIYDGATGMLANTVTGIRIPARGWRQTNAVLDKYAPGATQGYVRIRKISGNNPFLAYGVVNDGGAPGQRSGDGAYLPATETIHDPGTDPGTDPMTDGEVLEALYHATGGPDWINRINWLSDLPLSEWFGVRTDGAGRVTGLDLGGNGLSGPIPPELGSLANLQRLDLGENQLSGPIPPELGGLPRLRSLLLYTNSLTGPIPPELGKLANLLKLSLFGNDLTGPIPPELGNLANLLELGLAENDLTGSIPPELGNLSNLWILGLSQNSLTGPIPPELGKLSNVWSLTLVNNDLSGPIPPELGNLANLTQLLLYFNSLTGPIPPELGNMASLQFLVLDWNRLTGPIPPELGNLANLTHLALIQNSLTGPIPPELGSLANLQWLDLRENQLTGPIPPELGSLGNLERLALAFNRLTGPIPPELGNLSALTYLHLGGNNLTGGFPAFLLRLVRLESLFLGSAFCAPADPNIRAKLAEMETDLFPCQDTGVRLLPSALMREDGNGMSLALPDDLRTASAVTVSDPSVVDASVADGWLKLSPRRIGSAEVKVSQTAGGDSAVAHVDVREAVGTFGIDILVEEPVPFGYVKAMVEAADWWSYILDGTEWPDREAGCPTRDPFDGKVKALADELLVATRIEEREGISGYASGCFFPVGEGKEVPALDPGGGYVVMGGLPNQGLARHEIGHLLGLVSWRSEEGLATSDCQFFTGPHAVEAFRAGGGDPDLPGVPIQTGCGSHWHEDVVGYELMGPFGGWDANSISLGALVDAGYAVDLSKAMPWPWRAGSAAQAAGEGFAPEVVLGEPRVFIERRPREPPR